MTVDPARREFLGKAACACSAALGLWGTWGAANYLLPAASSARKKLVDAGSREELESKGHLLVPFYGTAGLVIFEAGQVRAFDARCTHAGCMVEWRGAERKFSCPCHGGVFDADGKQVSGPPPRPLSPIRAILRGSRVYLGD
jgi:cytochrome b6-f complex iron-sulfur subunit